MPNQFVLLSQPRSGAAYLYGLLGSHPGAFVTPIELFNLKETPVPERLPLIRDPLAYISKLMNRRGHAASGFRLGYFDGIGFDDGALSVVELIQRRYSPSLAKKQDALFAFVNRHGGGALIGGRFFDLWRALYAAKKVKIVHLKRRNRLRSFISLVQASISGLFASRSKSYHYIRESVQVPPKLFLDYCRTLDTEEIYIPEHFKEHPCLTLYYEDLVHETRGPALIESLQAFLKLPPRPLNCPYVKLRGGHPKQWIENYDEFIAAVRGTSWKHEADLLVQIESSPQ